MINENNESSNWKKLLGLRNMQEKLGYNFFHTFYLPEVYKNWEQFQKKGLQTLE